MKKDFKIFIGGKLMTIEEAKSQGWNLDYDLEMLRLWGYYDASTGKTRSEKVRKEISGSSDILKKSPLPRLGKTKRRFRNTK